jgi:acetyl esterase/lipase
MINSKVGFIGTVVFCLVASTARPQEANRTSNAKTATSPRDRVTEMLDVEYARAGEVGLKLDLYLPNDASTKHRPCVVWIHGGGWQGGSKSTGRQQVGSFAASGDYVAASVEYRFTDVATWPAQIHDCKAAIRFLRSNASKYGIDPDRIGVWGGSAGGHLVSLLGTSGDVAELEGDLGVTGVSSRVQCVVDYCGPADFMAFAKNAPKDFHQSGPVFKLFGGPIREHQAAAISASPITYVSKDDPPFLIVHGTKDELVPINQAELFYEAQVKAGMDSTRITIEGGGHGIGGDEIARRVRLFFAKHLLREDVQVSAETIVVGKGR